MNTRTTIVTALALGALAGVAGAQAPTTPVYSRVITDAVTGDNAFNFGGFRWWDVDANADSYQLDLYERPVGQTFQPVNGRYGAEEYHGYVDIAEARFGFDNRYLYASIRVFNLLKQTKDNVNTVEGLIARYGVRFAADPDGRNGVYLIADQTALAGLPSTVFSNAKTEGWRDTDRDVGGRGGPIHGRSGPSGLRITKVDNPLEEFGLNGYESQFIQSDGLLTVGGRVVLWQRVSPTSPTTVEIALDYVAAGFTRADIEAIRFLDFVAIAGNPGGPQDCLWNDKYTGLEAGSPNPGVGGVSEFGTQGLGDIYLADNVRDSISSCLADLNSDGELTFDDIQLFIGLFNANDVRADFNSDGELTFDDVQRFIQLFNAGC